MPARTYSALAIGAPRTYATQKRNAKIRPTLIMVDNTGLRGTHTAAGHPTIMTDANANFAAGELEGLTINNVTTGNSAVITANTVKTVTVLAIVGDWSQHDVYSISRAAPLAPDDRTIIIRDSFTPAVTNGVPAPVPPQNIDRLTFTVVVTGCASLRDELKDIEILGDLVVYADAIDPNCLITVAWDHK